MQSSFKFTENNDLLAKNEIAKYPKNRSDSAVMALLTLAQQQNNNYLSDELIQYVANYLNMPVIKVAEVATFYTMYNLQKAGKHQISVCSNIVCKVKGAQKVNDTLKHELKKQLSTKEYNELVSISEVECLGACTGAPVVSVDNQYIENVDQQKINEIIALLKKRQV